MARCRQFRGVSEINEDGFGGFTMDSVYFDELKGEKYVTSIFRKNDPEPSKEPENWNPTGFNFKAAVTGLPSKGKATKKVVPGGEVKRVHQSKKIGSRRAKEAKVSQVKKQLEGAFGDSNTDVMVDVTNRFEKLTGGIDYARKEEQEEDDQKLGSGVPDESEKCIDKDHDGKYECDEYVKKVTGFYESLDMSSIFPFDNMKTGDPKGVDKGKKIADQSAEEEEDDKMEEIGSEDNKDNF